MLWRTPSTFPWRACVLKNKENLKLSCFLSVLFKAYHCLVISRLKSIVLGAFMACLDEWSSFSRKLLFRYELGFTMIKVNFLELWHYQPWETSSLDPFLKYLSLRFMHPCSVNTPFALLDETRACWLQNLCLKFFRRECGELCVWVLKHEFCIRSSHLGFLT